MKKILIPTDFSKNADHAIDYALNLFRCSRANFYFVHAYADEAYQIGGFKSKTNLDTIKNKLESKVKLAIENTLARIQDPVSNPKHNYSSMVVFESLVDSVNNLVDQENIDLVVMGTKGTTMEKTISFGSNTVQVFKYVKCPVLAIPDNYKYQEPKHILFPTDYQLPYKRRELKLLDNIAGFFKSEVHCVYFTQFETLSHRQEDNKRFVEGTLSRSYLFFETQQANSVQEGISNYRENHEVDMLVMINSRHSFLEDMLYRSTVDKMGLNTEVPFMVMQNISR
ncbi:universal stress protein [Flagellimonas pacifica]|uniref:Nucleotide-binding universal stress protein, UspA family n=1 Tax=Flagellimonas pacifica TaxID=1247520 RepID=A0A285MU95_9FLAO|nr:universal stress protein [Allomuricauda parva]SNZ00742.1 Nucleotide-binding universal stress protein, UspA family [Allomuricauda parva]